MLVFRAPRVLSCGLGCFVRPWAAARPRAVRAASFARRVGSKPGQAPPPPTAAAARPSCPSGALHTSGAWCAGVWPGQAPPPATGTAARPSVPSGALYTGGVGSLMCGSTRRLVVRRCPATANGHRDRAREGMQKVRSPCGSADLRGTPAVPEFAQWRSAFTRCLVSASSLS